MKLTILYEQSERSETLTDSDLVKHVLLIDEMPNVKSYEFTRVLDTRGGAVFSSQLRAEIWFDSIEELKEALDSEQGQRVVAGLRDSPTGRPSRPSILISREDE